MKFAYVPGNRSLTVAALIATLINAAASIRAATVRERLLRIAHPHRGRA
jgi:hypothetical protein